MSIGVQNTNSALLALQTLGRLNDPSQAGGVGQGGQADATSSSSSSTQGSSTPAVATVAQGLTPENLGAATANLDRAASIADAALSAGQSVSDLLTQMKDLAGQTQGGQISGADANGGLADILQQLGATVSGSGFDGVNLLDGSVGSAGVTIGAGSGGQVTLTATNLSLGGPVITVGAGTSLSTESAVAGALSQIDDSQANLGQALGQISNQSRQISAHSSFVSRLGEALAAGGASAAAPTSADGARLMALQVSQQLSAQNGAIANATPNVVLSLFK